MTSPYPVRITGQHRSDLAQEIHRLRREGMTRIAIAAQLDVTSGQIKTILTHHQWSPTATGGTTADCPVCDVEYPVIDGRHADHGPCGGSGLRVGEVP